MKLLNFHEVGVLLALDPDVTNSGLKEKLELLEASWLRHTSLDQFGVFPRSLIF